MKKLKKRYYRWLYTQFYKRVLAVEKTYGNTYTAGYFIKLQNLMNFLKEALIEGEFTV